MIFSFLLKGNFAHFKQHLSFKTRTTYIAPLKTELIGLLLNIIGEYRKYTDTINEYIDKVETGVFIKKIGGLVLDSVNLRKMPKDLSKIDRVRAFYKMEILHNVEYIIFYKIRDKLLEEKLLYTLKDGYKGVPFLGISDFIAELIPIDIEVKETYSNIIHNSYIQEDMIKNIYPEENAIIRNQKVLFNSIKRFVFFYKVKAELKENLKVFEFKLENEERRVPVF